VCKSRRNDGSQPCHSRAERKSSAGQITFNVAS
jgi:hypothetical protein